VSGLQSAVLRRPAAGRTARFCYECLVFYGLLLVFGITSLVLSVAAGILHLILPRRAGAPLGQMTSCRYFVALMRLTGIIRCDLRELDALRRAGPLIIAPNHPSLLDAVLILSRLPHVVCAAKAELLDNPFLGGSARLAGFIRNDCATRFIREGARQLASGWQLLIFPEGTRTVGGRLGDFKGGFALIAKRAGVPVQTVFIDSNSRFLGKGWPLLRKPQFPLRYRMRLGPALHVEHDLAGFVAELHGCYRRALDDGDA
jgi:1-acyl-sn-glycerol-3-phosphate acyltransferase